MSAFGPVTTALAEYVGDRTARAPEAALDLAATAVLDTVGVALAAAAEPAVTRLLEALGGGNGTSTVLVDGSRTDARQAALLNGTAAHALDFDDVDDLLTGHPSTVLVPVVLAVGEQVGATGDQVADAYWRGLTTMRTLAAGLGLADHYARGWHSTATLGVLGAAAAAASLLSLAPGEIGHALGIAVSRAAGTRQNFGSMTKPLHAGVAAADGVLAAQLAAGGFTADPEALEGRYGFLRLYSGRVGEQDVRAATDRVRGVLASPGPALLNVKLYPCCYATNAPADAVLDLVAAGLGADEVASVMVGVPPGGLGPLIDHPARSGLEGKFSVEYVAAACLFDGALRLGSFTDAAVARPRVAELASRVTADESLPMAGSADGLEFRAAVTVRTRDGRELSARCEAPRGHASNPAKATDLRRKFDDCATSGGFRGADALHTALSGLRGARSVADALLPLSAVGARTDP